MRRAHPTNLAHLARTTTAWTVAGGLAAGCYSGLDSASDPLVEAPDDGAGSDGPSADDAADGGDDGPTDAQCVQPDVDTQPLRRLTTIQYANSVRDLLDVDTDVTAPFPLDERVGAFHSNAVAPVSDLVVEQYMDAAETLAVEAIAAHGTTLYGCDPGLAGEDACANSFIATMGKRVHRRPLTPAQTAMYRRLFEQGRDAIDFDNGMRLALQTMLQSPYFVYHVEVGQADAADAEVIPLTDYEIASRLSYFLWATTPDPTLLAAADAGELSDAEALLDHAQRMLADERAQAVIASFHLQWLAIDNMTAVEKDVELFPSFGNGLKEAMQQDVADFARYVMRHDDATLPTLLTAAYTFSDDPDLLTLYGVTPPADHVPGDPIPLDPTERAGLLTQAALLAKAAHVDQSSPVHRGVVIRENLFCQTLPPPPQDVDDTPPEPAPDATTRERFAEHTKDPSCAGCHAMIDGLGFGMEHYDAIGAYRTKEGALPVDASGDIIGTEAINGPFDGAIELSQRLAESVEVQKCVTRQWFNFALGRVPGARDRCSTDDAFAQFEASGLDLRVLMLSVAASDSFRYRRATEEGA